MMSHRPRLPTAHPPSTALPQGIASAEERRSHRLRRAREERQLEFLRRPPSREERFAALTGVLRAPTAHEAADLCTVCLEELNDTCLATIACGHAFHIDCIEALVRSQTTACPVCRRPNVITKVRDLVAGDVALIEGLVEQPKAATQKTPLA